MKKLYLNVFGNRAKTIIYNACVGTSLGLKAPVLENDNEVTLNAEIFSKKDGEAISPEKIKKMLVKRLKWYAKNCIGISDAVHKSPKTKNVPNIKIILRTENDPNQLKIEGLQAECIAKMISGTPIEEFKDSYDEKILKPLCIRRANPFASNAVEILMQEREHILKEYAQKIEEYAQKMRIACNAKIARIEKKIARLRTKN